MVYQWEHLLELAATLPSDQEVSQRVQHKLDHRYHSCCECHWNGGASAETVCLQRDRPCCILYRRDPSAFSNSSFEEYAILCSVN